MSSRKVIPNSRFFDEVRALLAQARQKAYAAINFAMVEAYWEIGRRIVEEEQQGRDRADYGAALIKELSRQLTSEFGKGFAVANLRNFRQFYLTFPEFQKGSALRSLLSWSHYRLNFLSCGLSFVFGGIRLHRFVTTVPPRSVSSPVV